MPDGVPPGFVPPDDERYKVAPKFQGEWMTCKGCGRKEKSNKKRESNWTFVQIDDGGFYICPVCFKAGKFETLLHQHLAGS